MSRNLLKSRRISTFKYTYQSYKWPSIECNKNADFKLKSKRSAVIVKYFYLLSLFITKWKKIIKECEGWTR